MKSQTIGDSITLYQISKVGQGQIHGEKVGLAHNLGGSATGLEIGNCAVHFLKRLQKVKLEVCPK